MNLSQGLSFAKYFSVYCYCGGDTNCVVLQLSCKLLVCSEVDACPRMGWSEGKFCGQMEKNKRVRYVKTFLFPTLVVIYHFPSECLLDLTSVMQEVTQNSERSQVMYCICLSHPSPSPLDTSRLLFKNWAEIFKSTVGAGWNLNLD